MREWSNGFKSVGESLRESGTELLKDSVSDSDKAARKAGGFALILGIMLELVGNVLDRQARDAEFLDSYRSGWFGDSDPNQGYEPLGDVEQDFSNFLHSNDAPPAQSEADVVRDIKREGGNDRQIGGDGYDTRDAIMDQARAGTDWA
jgi:hypothetical protein